MPLVKEMHLDTVKKVFEPLAQHTHWAIIIIYG